VQTAPGRLERLTRAFAAPQSHRVTIALALLLCAPALGAGLTADDYVLGLLSRDDSGVRGLTASPLWLFTFTTGDPAINHALMDEGVLLPWWSDPQHLNAFFRPLSSLTHVLDFRLWPDAPWLMHLHSLLWFAALLGVVAHVYRTLNAGPAWAAGMATFVYALDDAHGMPIAWIANRNALVALTLALPALSAHHRLRAEGWRPGRWAAPACLALGLCAGETALCVVTYLIAYALCEERGGLGARLRTLIPYLVVVLGWRAIYMVFGLGSAGSDAYHDPGREPVAYLTALVEHLPVLLGNQLALPLLADLAFWGGEAVRLACWIASVVGLAVVAWVLVPLLREAPRARFWALGMLLSAALVSASVPGSRLLLPVSVGAAPLIASAFERREGARGLRGLLLGLVLLSHLVFAPLGLPGSTTPFALLGKLTERADASLPGGDALTGKTLVIVNAPVDVMVSFLQVMREYRGAPRPAHLHWLATASSELEVRRDDARTLSVVPAAGLLATRPERHYRGSQHPLVSGQPIALTAFTVTPGPPGANGQPASAQFRFNQPLESPELLFVQFRDGAYRPFRLPAVGARVTLPAQDFVQLLWAQMLGP